ncbi:MAG: methyltransferase domain-containing protein [Thermodesulfobacteriota bacterium]|nr:methyltransferase domain-containing protein [Thermodesulfobacteriota bacterium]
MSLVDYNILASEYAKHRQVHPEVLRRLLDKSGIDISSRVLEVGCGKGNYIVAVKRSIDCHCWGIDPSEQMLAAARESSLMDIGFKIGSADILDFSAEYFDLVFSVDVIHHMDQHEAFYHEAYRVLRTGGKICTVTDSEDIIRHRQPLAVYFPETVEVDLNRYPPLRELREIINQVGFNDVSQDEVEFTYALDNIQLYQDKAFSCLHLISEESFLRGIEHMQRDIIHRPITCVPRYALLWATK